MPQPTEDPIAKRFARDTASHELTILHDDGLYRHLRYGRPETSIHHLDVVTWPGYLSVGGDIDGFTFRCAPDMFDFFRRSQWDGGPNPTYWDEKVAAGRHSVMDYSEEKLKALVAERLKEAEAKWPGVTVAWQEQTEGFLSEYDLGYAESARYALTDFTYLPEGVSIGDLFEFDAELRYETSFTDYRWSFLWACHGIVAAIREYDSAKAEAAA